MHDGDLTRSTFDAARHYSGVRLQQGRVQLDADWNEQVDIQGHHDRAAAVDAYGASGTPRAHNGFRLSLAPSGNDLLVSPGRCWVDGVLCETAEESTAATLAGAQATLDSVVLDDVPLAVHDWVRVTDSGGVQAVARVTALDVTTRTATLDPGPEGVAAPLTLQRLASYAIQPDLPEPPQTTQASAAVPRTLSLPDGQYLAYLDVWERPVTAVDDPRLREVALGGPDTTTRTRTVWQVRLLELAGAPAGLDDDADLSQWTDAAFAAPTGRLAARALVPPAQANLCTPTAAGGFVGLENRLYRVQVHSLSNTGAPRLVWSRENGSVSTSWSASNPGAGELTVGSIGPDAARGFGGDQWVELTDDAHLLTGTPGTLVRLLKAEGTTLFADTSTADGSIDRADFGPGAVARRWDQTGLLTPQTGAWTELEDGVQVLLTDGTFRPGDHWLVPARTLTGDVEWPDDPGGNPIPRLPEGVQHAYAPLSIVRVTSGSIALVQLLREFPSLTTLTAADVGYDDSVWDVGGVDAGIETVQEALDRLTSLHDLRRHQQRLHGWGIVDGLQVRCGPNPGQERRFVTVRPGAAITPLGDDLDLAETASVDVLDGVSVLEQQGGTPVLDAQGDGDVTLSMSMTELGPDGQPVMHVRRYEAQTTEDVLQGTLLMDFYRDNIKSLRDWLSSEFTPPPGDEGLPVGPQRQLVAALGNLAAQPVNPTSGQSIFISPREDALLQRFYTGLRQRLQSETFCAMFDGARTPPAYPQMPPGLDTIFGTGGHSRVRARPGAREVWTVGSGLKPLSPTALVNRYDLARGALVARIDPVAGVAVTNDNQVDAGTGPVTDVAFSPDGGTIYAVIPTRNENNTIFRAGRVTATDVAWQPAVTICGVKLVTLATTAADPNVVYAVAHHKQTTTTGSTTTTTWHATGIIRIDPNNVDPNPQPLPVQGFFPTGQLSVLPDGRAFAASMDADLAVGGYTSVVQLSLPGGQEFAPRLQLPQSGNDDLAAFSIGIFQLRRSRLAVVVGTTSKGVMTYDVDRQVIVGDGVPEAVHAGSGPVSLAAAGPLFGVSVADEYVMKVLDSSTGHLLPDKTIPLQVGPVSVATSAGALVALNYVSNTLSVVPAKVLEPGVPIDLKPLTEYRAGMLEAFADLLGGFLQYLKDGFFDHFLVNRPEPTGDEVLYLAAISIRNRQVYRVCNFSRRKYVKSFPLVGYWLSAIPVLPLLGQRFAELACTVLVQWFGKYQVSTEQEQAADRVSVSQLTRLLAFGQSQTVSSRLGELRGRRTMVGNAIRLSVPEAPRPTPAVGDIVKSSVVGQPVDSVVTQLQDSGVTVEKADAQAGGGILGNVGDLTSMLGEARPGDTVTLFETDGKVQFFKINRSRLGGQIVLGPPVGGGGTPPSGEGGTPPEAPTAPVNPATDPRSDVGTRELYRRLAALEAEVSALRVEQADALAATSATAKKTAATKTTAKKATGTKKTTATKATAKKTTAKKTAAKKATPPPPTSAPDGGAPPTGGSPRDDA